MRDIISMVVAHSFRFHFDKNFKRKSKGISNDLTVNRTFEAHYCGKIQFPVFNGICNLYICFKCVR